MDPRYQAWVEGERRILIAQYERATTEVCRSTEMETEDRIKRIYEKDLRALRKKYEKELLARSRQFPHDRNELATLKIEYNQAKDERTILEAKLFALEEGNKRRQMEHDEAIHNLKVFADQEHSRIIRGIHEYYQSTTKNQECEFDIPILAHPEVANTTTSTDFAVDMDVNLSPPLAECSPSVKVAAEQARATCEADLQKSCAAKVLLERTLAQKTADYEAAMQTLKAAQARIADLEMRQVQDSTSLENQQAGWSQKLQDLEAENMGLVHKCTGLVSEAATLRERCARLDGSNSNLAEECGDLDVRLQDSVDKQKALEESVETLEETVEKQKEEHGELAHQWTIDLARMSSEFKTLDKKHKERVNQSKVTMNKVTKNRATKRRLVFTLPDSDDDEDVPGDVPGDVPADVPADVPGNVPGHVPGDVLVDVSEDVPLDVPTEVPLNAPEEAADQITSNFLEGLANLKVDVDE